MMMSRAGKENCLNWKIFPDAPDANKHQTEISRLGLVFFDLSLVSFFFFDTIITHNKCCCLTASETLI